MKVLVIDGQGGNLGRQLVKRISEDIPEAEITAVGTNSIATGNMLKAGDCLAATGENAVMMLITPAMASAVGSSKASRVLIPVNRCDTYVAGISSLSAALLIEDAVKKIKELSESKNNS